MGAFAVREGIAAFHQYMDEALAEKPDAVWRTSGRPSKAWPNGEDEQFWRTSGEQWLQKYYQWRLANPTMRLWTIPGTDEPAIEMSVVVQVPDSTITLKGFIDRVFHNVENGTLHIVDLKSGKNPQPSPLQLCFYRLGIKQQFDVDIRYGSYYDARSGGLDAIYDLDQFPPDLVSRWIRNMSRTIELGDYTPNIGRHCDWCSHKPDCYVWNPDVERPAVDSDLEVQ